MIRHPQRPAAARQRVGTPRRAPVRLAFRIIRVDGRSYASAVAARG